MLGVKLKESVRSSLFAQINEKSSLFLFKQLSLSPEGAGYLKVLPKYLRVAVAKFRLGNYIWEANKDSFGVRMCPLCGDAETPSHILLSCLSSNSYRPFNLESHSLVGLANCDDPAGAAELGKFLIKFFEERKNSLR